MVRTSEMFNNCYYCLNEYGSHQFTPPYFYLITDSEWSSWNPIWRSRNSHGRIRDKFLLRNSFVSASELSKRYGTGALGRCGRLIRNFSVHLVVPANEQVRAKGVPDVNSKMTLDLGWWERDLLYIWSWCLTHIPLGVVTVGPGDVGVSLDGGLVGGGKRNFCL